MQHEQVAENLSAYVEGSLSPAMAAAIENHLRECADCFIEATALRRVYELLDSPAAVVEPPSTFHADTMRRIRVAQRERAIAAPRIPFWRRPILAGFGAVTAALVLLAVYNNIPSGLDGSRAGYTIPVKETVITLTYGGGQSRQVRLDASRLGNPSAGLAVASVVNGVSSQPMGAGSGRIVVSPAAPGDVVEVTLAPVASGAAAEPRGWTVFIPSADAPAASPMLETPTVREALAAVSRANAVPIVAPSAALARAAQPLSTNTPAAFALAEIAGHLEMRAEYFDGSWYLLL